MFHGRLKLPFKNRDPLSWVARCDGFPETKSICSSSSRRSPSGRAFMHDRLNSRRALLQFGGVSYGAIERDPAVKAGSVEGSFRISRDRKIDIEPRNNFPPGRWQINGLCHFCCFNHIIRRGKVLSERSAPRRARLRSGNPIGLPFRFRNLTRARTFREQERSSP